MSASGHIVTWAHRGDGMPVQDPTKALDRVQWALWVWAGGGRAAVAGSKGSLVVSVGPLASISSPLGAWPFSLDEVGQMVPGNFVSILMGFLLETAL